MWKFQNVSASIRSIVEKQSWCLHMQPFDANACAELLDLLALESGLLVPATGAGRGKPPREGVRRLRASLHLVERLSGLTGPASCTHELIEEDGGADVAGSDGVDARHGRHVQPPRELSRREEQRGAGAVGDGEHCAAPAQGAVLREQQLSRRRRAFRAAERLDLHEVELQHIKPPAAQHLLHLLHTVEQQGARIARAEP
mmetsp:Transcript_60110/g.137841  ORF Transcript_60110/g.137841 Transcript_60110/m.137841 type:complete len:200 (-) Transcript_60110:253-852(-)